MEPHEFQNKQDWLVHATDDDVNNHAKRVLADRQWANRVGGPAVKSLFAKLVYRRREKRQQDAARSTPPANRRLR